MIYIKHMHEVNIKNLDLNLLVALEALLNESSVTRAAESVSLSQPAMSRALERLRHMLKDPLLVRSGRGMILTPRAEGLRVPLQDALERVRSVLAPNAFDPATSQAQFRIMGADYFTQVMMPKVLARLYHQAPNIQVDLVNMSMAAVQSLKAGEIDLGIGVIDDGPDMAGAFHQKLFEDDFVCVMSKDHQLVEQALSLDEFCKARHAMMSITGRGTGAIDRRLQELGRTRKTVLRLPHFLAIPSVISQTDLLISMPRKLAATFPQQGIHVQELPAELRSSSFSISQIWHERFHHDPARKWLRAIVKGVSREV